MIYPSLQKVKKLSLSYNRIPLYRELNLSELGLLSLLKALQQEKEIIFLESARQNKTWSRFSFFGLNPKRKIIFHPPFIIERSSVGERIVETDFFGYLRSLLAGYRSPNYSRFGNFSGGLAGYFGFEMVNHTGILRRPVRNCPHKPAALLMDIDDFIVYDNAKDRYYIATCLYPEPGLPIEELYNETLLRLAEMEREIITLVRETSVPYLPSQPEEITLNFRTPREDFLGKVEAVREMIASGEAIQVVLSLRADIQEEIDPYRFYLKLRSVNPSPYMFFLKSEDLAIVGSSPEIHVKAEGDKVFLKPIAGTVPQGGTRRENLENKERLLQDPKERAEHLMLVDLARNDLGRISAGGTVNVDYFMIPEDYSHVIHLVSLVTCRLSENRDMVDVLRETFPAGTVSGAPKVRAIEIIDEMEDHPRDIYAGAVGYLGYNGYLDTCITIRTAVFNGKERYVQAGAGIVYDSVPEKEYEEIRSKLRALSVSLQYAHAEKKEAVHVSHGR